MLMRDEMLQRFLRFWSFCLIPILFATSCLVAQADEWKTSHAQFLLLTQKGGVASAFAHNHVIAAPGDSLRIEGQSPLPQRASFKVAVADLLVDDAEILKSVSGRMQELGVVDAPYAPISDGDRQEIWKNMLDEGQLHAERFPELQVEASGFRRREGGELPEKSKFVPTHEADFKFTVRGKTHSLVMPLAVDLSESEMTIEGFARAKFSDFGIEPYSAFLGAVKNQDEFTFYLKLSGEWIKTP